MREAILKFIEDVLDYRAALKRRVFRRPIICPPTNDVERLQNLSRNLYGDDRLLRYKIKDIVP